MEVSPEKMSEFRAFMEHVGGKIHTVVLLESEIDLEALRHFNYEVEEVVLQLPYTQRWKS